MNKGEMRKRVLRSGLLAIALAMVAALAVFLPGVARAEGEDTGAVAKIGEKEYATFAEAAAAVQTDETITLLDDCASGLTNAWAINKNVTITGNHTVTFSDYSFGITGNNTLKLDGCKVVINNAAHTAYSDNPANAAIMLDKGGSLTLDNGASLLIDSPRGDGIATYDTSSDMRETISILNGSSYECKNAKNGGGIEDYNNETGRTVNVNITNGSKVYFHENYSGFIASLTVTVDNSTVDVLNSSGNGSNGTYYKFKNNSVVTFGGNGSWGISAWCIDMSNGSKLTATNNGYSGIWTRVINADGTCTIDVENNGGKAISSATAPGIFFQGNGTYASTLDAGSSLTINNNAGAGIYTKQGVCNLTINSNAEITGNGKGYTTVGKYGADNGGGVYNIGTMVLADTVAIYNNHAEYAGDDIYSTKSITFGSTQDVWMLDGDTDKIGCSDAITGWFDDATDSRWEAHYASALHVHEVSAGTLSGTQALKAAHGVAVGPADPDTNFEISKSKSATNLEKQTDGTYTSDVTLSLPAKEEQLVSDVVLVLDKSTSADLETQALSMLSNLKNQITATNAKVNVGVVIFNKVANVANNGNFFDLSTQYDKIETAIKQEISSGTNTHAGLLAGKKMLDEDTDVDASRKYLIFVSDGITYMYGETPTATAWSFNTPNAADDWHGAGSWNTFAGPDNWRSKYHNNNAPSDWSAWISTIKSQVESQSTTYEYPYGGTATTATDQDLANWDTNYAMSVDKALYLTYEEYTAAESEGYHVYAMTATSSASYPWASSFMDYLANGKSVTFFDIENDIYYLIGAGSKVTDVIGNTDDYNFDFEDDAANLELTVGDTAYVTTKVTDGLATNETSRYDFTSEGVSALNGAEAPFVLHYYKNGVDGTSDECFVWDINVHVSQFESVQLTYTVRLMNPKTIAGTYGEYHEYGTVTDADGNISQYQGSLYTNNSAVLSSVDSDGNASVPESFYKPTVSYTVEKVTPPTPSKTTYTVKVVKQWITDDGGTKSDSVTVNIKNGSYSDSVILNEANGWKADAKTFSAYSTSAKDWSATEVNVPDGFKATTKVDVAGSVVTITVTNDDVAKEDPTPASVDIVGKKTLSGATLTEGQFTFTLWQVVNGEYKSVATATNAADGTIKFAVSGLTADATYVVTENRPTSATAENSYTVDGMTYDASEQTIKVTVTLDSNSNAYVATATSFSFKNTYKAPEEPVNPTPMPTPTEPTEPTKPASTTTPKAVPTVGDSTNTFAPVALLAVAAAAVAGALVVRRKGSK